MLVLRHICQSRNSPPCLRSSETKAQPLRTRPAVSPLSARPSKSGGGDRNDAVDRLQDVAATGTDRSEEPEYLAAMKGEPYIAHAAQG